MYSSPTQDVIVQISSARIQYRRLAVTHVVFQTIRSVLLLCETGLPAIERIPNLKFLASPIPNLGSRSSKILKSNQMTTTCSVLSININFCRI